jgi:hypothetical protein
MRLEIDAIPVYWSEKDLALGFPFAYNFAVDSDFLTRGIGLGGIARIRLVFFGAVAQLGERLNRTQEVGSSNLLSSIW